MSTNNVLAVARRVSEVTTASHFRWRRPMSRFEFASKLELNLIHNWTETTDLKHTFKENRGVLGRDENPGRNRCLHAHPPRPQHLHKLRKIVIIVISLIVVVAIIMIIAVIVVAVAVCGNELMEWRMNGVLISKCYQRNELLDEVNELINEFITNSSLYSSRLHAHLGPVCDGSRHRQQSPTSCWAQEKGNLLFKQHNEYLLSSQSLNIY